MTKEQMNADDLESSKQKQVVGEVANEFVNLEQLVLKVEAPRGPAFLGEGRDARRLEEFKVNKGVLSNASTEATELRAGLDITPTPADDSTGPGFGG